MDRLWESQQAGLSVAWNTLYWHWWLEWPIPRDPLPPALKYLPQHLVMVSKNHTTILSFKLSLKVYKKKKKEFLWRSDIELISIINILDQIIPLLTVHLWARHCARGFIIIYSLENAMKPVLLLSSGYRWEDEGTWALSYLPILSLASRWVRFELRFLIPEPGYSSKLASTANGIGKRGYKTIKLWCGELERGLANTWGSVHERRTT